eukprot:scaffold113618_cov21-Tisochrysis_lutea.AAC.1
MFQHPRSLFAHTPATGACTATCSNIHVPCLLTHLPCCVQIPFPVIIVLQDVSVMDGSGVTSSALLQTATLLH